MRYKVLLVLTLAAYIADGRAPGMRALSNPDAEHGAPRPVLILKRATA